MEIEILILFILSTIGMCNIIVDSSIMEPFRNGFKTTCEIAQDAIKYFDIPFFNFNKLSSLVTCYMCCGTWCGFLQGYIWISHNPWMIFACGCAGSFLAHYATVHVNWMEAMTIVNLPDEE